MEYMMYEHLVGGALGARVAYRDANPRRLEAICDVTDRLIDAIAARIDACDRLPHLPENRPIVRRTGYGAEIYVTPEVFSVVAGDFQGDVRECAELCWTQTLA